MKQHPRPQSHKNTPVLQVKRGKMSVVRVLGISAALALLVLAVFLNWGILEHFKATAEVSLKYHTALEKVFEPFDKIRLKSAYFSEILMLWWPAVLGVLGVQFVLLVTLWKILRPSETQNADVLRQQLDQEKSRRQVLETKANQFDIAITSAFSESPDGFAMITPDMFLNFVNPAATNILGKWTDRTEPVEGRHMEDIIPGFKDSELRRHIATCLEEDISWAGTIHLENTRTWLYVRIFSGYSGIFLTLTDITQRKQPTAHLKLDSGALAEVLQTMPIPAAIVDMTWHYTLCNPAWRAVFDLKEEGVAAGASHKEALPDLPPNLSQLQHRLEAGNAIHLKDLPYTVKGEEERFAFSIQPCHNNQGKTVAFAMFAEETTMLFKATRQEARLKEKEHQLAYHDVLTGLPNRQLFYDRLNMALAQAYRQLGKVCLMFLDLDGFKQINDTMGHDAGDALLKEVSRRLQACVRETDTIARLGGDEFTVILNNLPDDSIVNDIAEKILQMTSEPYRIHGKDITHISTSIGVSLYPDNGTTTTELIKQADMAMYNAKESGKNAIVFYEAMKGVKVAAGS